MLDQYETICQAIAEEGLARLLAALSGYCAGVADLNHNNREQWLYALDRIARAAAEIEKRVIGTQRTFDSN